MNLNLFKGSLSDKALNSVERKAKTAIYRAKYVFGKSLNLKRPVDVSLELAGECNQRCSYCYYADRANLPFKTGFMTWEMAQKIVMQSAEIGVHSLKFNYRGESTLNPIFPKVTGLAKSLAKGSVFIDRITNSNFKFPTSNESIFQGLCSQTKVKISYDSFDKSVFETQRAGGNHETTTRNIDKFYNYPGRENHIVIQAVRTKLNKDEDIEYQAKMRWPHATISIRDMVEGRVEKNLDSLTDKKRDASGRQSCIQAHVRIIFTHEGKATPCCPSISENLIIGNIKEQSVLEIFNSFEAIELRKSLKNKSAFDKDPCKTCSSFESYRGYKPAWNS